MLSGKSLPSFISYDTQPRAGGFIDGRFMSGIRVGSLVALAAVGLSLIYGVTSIVNFAHAEMVGSYALYADAKA